MQVSAAKPSLSLRRARSSRLRPPLVARRRRRQPPVRLVAAVALPIAVLAVLALVARRRFFQGLAVIADAIEEAADVVEDAAEDFADAAREQAERAD
jgi:hypothetical protein